MQSPSFSRTYMVSIPLVYRGAAQTWLREMWPGIQCGRYLNAGSTICDDYCVDTGGFTAHFHFTHRDKAVAFKLAWGGND